MIKVEYMDMFDKTHESTLADALAYASMAFDACGFKPVIFFAGTTDKVAYIFTSARIAKAV